MFSSVSRAFIFSTTQASISASRISRRNASVTRSFIGIDRLTNGSRLLSSSSTGSEEERTVVATVTEKIKKALDTDNVTVRGAYDDPNGSHIAIEVISDKFE